MCGASFGRSAMTTASTFSTTKPASRTMANGAAEQLEAVRVAILRIGVWKMPSDVALPGRAENRVGDCVAERVAVGMTLQSHGGGDVLAAEHQLAPLDVRCES